MKISKKTDYALRVLFTLIENYGLGPISIRELAKMNNVPKRFLEHVILEMKGEGWVASIPGRNGGYVLAQDPENLTMGQIVRHFDGVLAPIGCVSVTGYEPCSEEKVCRFRPLLSRIRDTVAQQMDEATLKSVYESSMRVIK